MVCGVGLGTELALNGTTAHAFSHILYKALLFMGAGAVLEVTGRRNLSEMGGLYKTMPVTLSLYMIGAFAISAVPLFSGFVSKSMVVSAAGESHRAAIFLTLTLASAGTFLHTGLKLPYYMFFARDRSLRAHEPPSNMLVAMGLAAAACIIIGVFPALLYSQLPYGVEYAPYTVRHVLATLGLLSFTALGFFALLAHLDPEPKISLDTDWFYRRLLPAAAVFAFAVLVRAENVLAYAYEGFVRRPLLGAAAWFRQVDASVVDRAAEGIGIITDAVSQSLKLAVTGHAQYYGLLMAAGVLMAIAIAILVG
jgi:multicomponent Na+:H+ antiporter subunit D